jgi:hypothetical protein
MDEEIQRRRDAILLDAIDPLNGKKIKVQLSYQRLQAIAGRSKGQVMETGYIIPEILQHPTAIFEGLTKDDDEDRRGVGWRCYCGIPSKSYRTDGAAQNAFPGQIFLVFVNQERIAHNWRWEKCDQAECRLPENHSQRFKRRLL